MNISLPKRLLSFPVQVIAFLFLFTAFNTTGAEAQTGVIARGRVLDENRAPVSGATVQLKNTVTATTTDTAGNFSLAVPSASSVLVVSYVGYGTKEIAAGTR